MPAIYFLDELREIFDLHISTSVVHSKVLEDNTACIFMAKSKMSSPSSRSNDIAL